MIDTCATVSSKTDASLWLSLHCIKNLSPISSATFFSSFSVKFVECEPLL